MPTWLHDVEVYASLAGSEAGPARDWGTLRLALAAPERFSVFPEDERAHEVALAAAPPSLVPSLVEALRTRKPCPLGIADSAAALGFYGLLPEDPTELIGAMRGALRRDGHEADRWLAYGLATLGGAERDALTACAKVTKGGDEWVLPLVALRAAEGMGNLDAIAEGLANDLRADARDPHRLFALLGALAIPVAPLMRPYKDADEAVKIGASMAHAAPPDLAMGSGSQRRRMQRGVEALLKDVPGPAAALLRKATARDPLPQWGLWPAAIAAWMHADAHRHEHAHGDDIHHALFHGLGSDGKALSAARRQITPAQRDEIARGLADHPTIAAAVLAMPILRETADPELIGAILNLHGGEPEADVRLAALAGVAAFHAPDQVVALLESPEPRKRALGLICAEWVQTAEVLAALLALPIPADLPLRKQYAWAMASMADAATIPHLEALFRADEGGEMADSKRLAEELLRVSL